MNSHYKTIKAQWKVLFVIALLVVLRTSSVAFISQGQPDIEKKVDALTAQDIPALLQKAQSGDVTAQYMIGQAYYLGKGTAKDATEALKWLRKASEQGYALAQFSLFGMYSKGEGVPANDKEAMKWLRKAAEGGLASAEFVWGYSIEQSQRDFSQAAKWYRKAEEQGFAPAQNALGFLFEQGRGVRQDSKESVTWYRKAAEQGDANAQSNLGNMYNEGRGVGKDFNEAVKWFRMSAEQGWAVGQANLAGKYISGEGVPRDLVSAYMWCSLAAAAGISDCQEALKVLESTMTIQETTEAKGRTLAWSQTHPEAIKAADQPKNEGSPRTDPTQKNTSSEKIRARAVELATALENDPLSKKAKGYRKEMKELMGKKELGVSIMLCMRAIGQDLFKDEYEEELLTQFIYSQVKFSIQHPDKAEDIFSVTLASIEGVLRVYTIIKTVKPGIQSTELENLLQKRQSGLLEDHIRSGGC